MAPDAGSGPRLDASQAQEMFTCEELVGAAPFKESGGVEEEGGAGSDEPGKVAGEPGALIGLERGSGDRAQPSGTAASGQGGSEPNAPDPGGSVKGAPEPEQRGSGTGTEPGCAAHPNQGWSREVPKTEADGEGLAEEHAERARSEAPAQPGGVAGDGPTPLHEEELVGSLTATDAEVRVAAEGAEEPRRKDTCPLPKVEDWRGGTMQLQDRREEQAGTAPADAGGEAKELLETGAAVAEGGVLVEPAQEGVTVNPAEEAGADVKFLDEAGEVEREAVALLEASGLARGPADVSGTERGGPRTGEGADAKPAAVSTSGGSVKEEASKQGEPLKGGGSGADTVDATPSGNGAALDTEGVANGTSRVAQRQTRGGSVREVLALLGRKSPALEIAVERDLTPDRPKSTRPRNSELGLVTSPGNSPSTPKTRPLRNLRRRSGRGETNLVVLDDSEEEVEPEMDGDLPAWAPDSRGKIACPGKEWGGCGKGELELRSLQGDKWMEKLDRGLREVVGEGGAKLEVSFRRYVDSCSLPCFNSREPRYPVFGALNQWLPFVIGAKFEEHVYCLLTPEQRPLCFTKDFM